MSYDTNDLDTYAVYDEVYRRARKTHRCQACGLTINPGERYASVHAVWAGSAETIKRCGRCQTIHEHLKQQGNGDTWPDERLDCGLDYEEEWGEPPPLEIQAVVFATSEEASALLGSDRIFGPGR